MELIVKLLSTFAAGAVWLWWAIPTGIVMGLPPLLSGAAATLGNLGVVLFFVVLNEQFRRWFVHYRLVTKQGERLKRVWSSYGLPGVALLSPLLKVSSDPSPPKLVECRIPGRMRLSASFHRENSAS